MLSVEATFERGGTLIVMVVVMVIVIVTPLEQARGHPTPKPTRKVDIRLPGKGNSNSHGARPVY